MIYCENSAIHNIAIHFIGNKINNELCKLSKSNLQLNETDKALLVRYFVAPFLQKSEYFNFHHAIDINMNEVFVCASKIFANPETLLEQSVNLAKHLYEQSTHPKIKGGEFYTVYFKDCVIDGKTVDAVGLFKSENKDTFLKVFPKGEGFEIESEQGININKLDKGCLIFNTEQENGYVLSIVDNTNKGVEAQYWKDDFLSVLVLNNDFHQTNQFLSITKNFVTKQLDEEFEITKADKIDLLNRSVDYFKTHDQFDKEEFEAEVFNHSNLIQAFQQFDQNYRKENEVELSDNFVISEQAVKKQARVFKSVLKLDKNFHIYIHGNRELIEQGIDENGRKYYKIYYERES